jgi:integrase
VLSSYRLPGSRYPTTLYDASSCNSSIRGAYWGRDPRIHDLRHTFAVRSLEQCRHGRAAVARHILALSTYLGHAHVTDTYWYLQATPALMGQIAEAGEALLIGGAA